MVNFEEKLRNQRGVRLYNEAETKESVHLIALL